MVISLFFSQSCRVANQQSRWWFQVIFFLVTFTLGQKWSNWTISSYFSKVGVGLKLNYQLPTHQPPRSRPRLQFLNTSTPTLPQKKQMDVSKNRGVSPKMDGLYWKTLLKWMIWRYHYFWKHPNSPKIRGDFWLIFSGCKVGHEVGYNIRFEERWPF